MRSLTSGELFYNGFHSTGKQQYKVITENNFTYRNVIEAIKRFTTVTNSNVLDYGCGVGTMSLYLARKGYKVYGVDISPKSIEIAKNSAKSVKLDKLTTFSTLRSWDSNRFFNKFDLIIAIEVIEHIKESDATLLLLNKYLKAGGKIILSTPSVNAPLYRMGLLDDFDKRVGHVHRYSSNELIKKFSRAGFKVIELKKTEGIFRNALFTIPFLGFMVRFIKGPISSLVTWVDNCTVSMFGESNIYIIAVKQ
jgi:2-polyprenyl-3-methyl-5-hydroxy-6-metoxy-1,4-benzoquinol methylase